MKIQRNRRGAAFTLVEILIAITLFGLVSAGMTSVLIQILSIQKYDTAKLLVNRDMRKFTSEMTEVATYANYFRIYPNYQSFQRTVATLKNPNDPEEGYTTKISGDRVVDGDSGDCLVLVYKNATDDRKVARLVIYYRLPTAKYYSVPAGAETTMKAGVRVSNKGPLYKIEVPIDSSDELEYLIPPITTPAANPMVLPEVMVTSPVLVKVPGSSPERFQNWGLFYNYRDKSVILEGELIRTGSQINAKNVSATNTYNFTVSPRG